MPGRIGNTFRSVKEWQSGKFDLLLQQFQQLKMEWLKELLVEHSALQAVVVISLISTLGIGLGKIRFFGISLGTAFIFFVGILAVL